MQSPRAAAVGNDEPALFYGQPSAISPPALAAAAENNPPVELAMRRGDLVFFNSLQVRRETLPFLAFPLQFCQRLMPFLVLLHVAAHRTSERQREGAKNVRPFTQLEFKARLT